MKVGQTGLWVQSGPFTTTGCVGHSDHSYGKKFTSFRQLTAVSLSSNFLTSACNLGGNSLGTS
jgi:hypothetical protein